MNVKAFFLFSLLLLFSGFLPISGQAVEDSLYNRLGSASLMVRLPGQQKKIKAMQAGLTDPNVSETAKKRMQSQLEKVMAETAAQNKLIVVLFQEHFKAMPIYFVYDTTRHPAQTVFLDKTLQPITAKPGTDQVIQLRFGRPLADAGNRPESMVLADSQLQDLGAPFPKPLPMTSIGFGINKLLAPEIAFERLLEKRVKKLNQQLAALNYGVRDAASGTQ